jgi:hypothetical protein
LDANTGLQSTGFRIFAFALIVINTLALLVLAAVALVPLGFQPLGEYSLQLVLAPRDPDGLPVVRLSDGFVPVEATKCSNVAYPISVTGSRQWRQAQGDTTTVIGPTGNGVGTRAPGCHTLTFKNVLPPSLTPGVWRLSGEDDVVGGFWVFQNIARQVKPWQTEAFRVIP